MKTSTRTDLPDNGRGRPGNRSKRLEARFFSLLGPLPLLQTLPGEGAGSRLECTLLGITVGLILALILCLVKRYFAGK